MVPHPLPTHASRLNCPFFHGSLGGVFPSRLSGTCARHRGVDFLSLSACVALHITWRYGAVVLFLEPRNVRIQEQELFSDGARLVRTQDGGRWGNGSRQTLWFPGRKAWTNLAYASRSSSSGKSASVSMCIAR